MALYKFHFDNAQEIKKTRVHIVFIIIFIIIIIIIIIIIVIIVIIFKITENFISKYKTTINILHYYHKSYIKNV